MFACMCVYMYVHVCMYVCVCLCVCVNIYMYLGSSIEAASVPRRRAILPHGDYAAAPAQVQAGGARWWGARRAAPALCAVARVRVLARRARVYGRQP